MSKYEPFLKMESSFTVMPRDANHYGNMHGGIMVQYADNLAYAIASQYSRMNVVTARIHEINFILPVKVGDLVLQKAEITRVGNSSMDVKVCIKGENLLKGEIFDVADALFTMVAVGNNGKPKKIRK
jgi:uncharacterized protein (TIGR00369 family)